MKTLISIPGANATGKSTRLRKYIESLGNDYTEVTFNQDGKERTIGRQYGNILIVGKYQKNGNWVSADAILGSHFGSIEKSTKMIEGVMQNADVMIIEGYFCLGHKSWRPAQKAAWFDTIHQYWFIYDTLEEYVARTESRSGISWESRGKDPAKSAGWAGNKGFTASSKIAREDIKEIDGTVTMLKYDTDVDYFVTEIPRVLGD